MGYGTAYQYLDNNYYNYSYSGGGYGDTEHGCSQIEYAIEEGEYIYIFDKFIYVCDFEYENLSGCYTDSEKLELVGKDDFEWQQDYSEIHKLIYKYYDKLDTYKHTFKKGDNGSYYWISTEKL